MSRQAFEEWLNPGHHTGNVSPWVEPGRYEKETHQLAWLAWQAATNAALEKAAEVCDHVEVFAWEQWKATGNQHTEGVSDGAASLALDIRALKESKE